MLTENKLKKGISACLVLLLLFHIPVLFKTSGEGDAVSIDGGSTSTRRYEPAPLPLTDPERNTREDPEQWYKVDSMRREVTVERGGQTFVHFDHNTGRLTLSDELDHYGGLSPRAKEAVERAPGWVRDELARKLAYTAIAGHRSSGVGSAFGDLNGDNRTDMLSFERGRLTYYENCGTSHQSLFRADDALFEPPMSNNGKGPSHPTLGDLDGDGDLDIVLGKRDALSIYENTGTAFAPAYSRAVDLDPAPGMNRPSLLDLDGNGYSDIVLGKEDGTLEYRVNDGENIGGFQTSPLTFAALDVGENATPSGADLDADGDIDLVVGSASPLLHHFTNIGTPSNPVFSGDDLSLFSGIKAGVELRPSLTVLDTDDLHDLVLTSSSNRYFFYDNIGTGRSPEYKISSSYEVWPGRDYYPPNILLKVVGEDAIDHLTELLLTCPEHLVDEIAYSVAYTSETVLLKDEVIPRMFLENAETIYGTDAYLDYVELVEKENGEGDPYTTTRYRVIDDGEEKEITLPRDIYYRFVVHPKVTEELPGYIDPDTGGHATPYPEGKGRFWREYLFYHNDSSYPDDPDPDDDLDNYPANRSPPLLKELLSGIKVLFNSTTHKAPGGRDDRYGENAVIRVSNWVGKTLILNQQEVSDDERPIQPVRIARGHNGNCGELQDLTVAAARSALIPATGVIMTGEDHVWIEFWERGWHQWDNYWSDGASVIDDWDNYWENWGERGGSGIYKWHGNDMIEDVTPQYVPRNVLSDVIVRVTDRTGSPVDGARVIIGSHWLIEHSTDSPVTAPFPSIWNYTDSDGVARFTLTSNNISIKVISRLGNGAVSKTYIDPGTVYEFNVSLEGRKPRPVPKLDEIGMPAGEDWKIRYDLEVVGAYQRPPNANTGSFHTRPIPTARHMDLSIIPGEELGRIMHNGRAKGYKVENDVGRYRGALVVGEERSLSFLLRNCDQVETYKIVRVDMEVYRKAEERPYVSITEPRAGDIFTLQEDIRISGRAHDKYGIRGLNLSFGSTKVDILSSLDNGTFTHVISAGSLEEGEHVLSAEAVNIMDLRARAEVSILISSLRPPGVVLTSPDPSSVHYLGRPLPVEGEVTGDPLETLVLIVEGENVSDDHDITEALTNKEFEYELNTSRYAEGEYELTVKATDHRGFVGKAAATVRLRKARDPEYPELTLESPANYGEFTIGEKIPIRGKTRDNVGVTELNVIVDGGGGIDILDKLSGSDLSYDLPSADMAKGEHEVRVEAGDDAGNTIWVSRRIILTEPEIIPPVPPEIRFTGPAADILEYGEVYTVRADIVAEGGVTDMDYTLDGGVSWEAGGSYFDPVKKEFAYELATGSEEVGLLEFGLRVRDESDQTATETILLDIRDTTPPAVEFEEPVGERYEITSELKIVLSVSDLSPIREVSFRLVGNGPGLTRRIKRPERPYSFTLNLSDLLPGDHTLVVRVKDEEGNVGSVTADLTITGGETTEGEGESANGYPGILVYGLVFIAVVAAVCVAVLAGRR